jgi:radical SAM protein with 4Fe4S-binding SPASM domain
VYEEMMLSGTEKHQDQKRKTFLFEKGETISIQSLQKERIFRLLDILAEAEVFEVRLFGGEFTVFKPWKEVLEYASAKGFFVSFVSNGYLLNEADVKLLAQCGVRDCTISVHGPEDVHDAITRKLGSFAKAMRTIQLLSEEGIVVSVAYTPNVENLCYVYDFVKLLFQTYGVKNFSISRLFNDARYKNLTLQDYLYLLSEICRAHEELRVNISLADSFPRCQVPMKFWPYLSYCSQGVGFAQVDFNGNMKHCSGTSKPLGSLFEEDMKTLWLEKLEGMRNLDHLPLSCKMCPIFCGGGCTVSRGVEQQFAPDEFIPWPKDETLWGALGKSTYNLVRKVSYQAVQRLKTKGQKIKEELPKFPKVSERYRVREESPGVYLAMFEKSGVKQLSSDAVYILGLLDGTHTADDIAALCQRRSGTCSTKSDVLATIRELL